MELVTKIISILSIVAGGLGHLLLIGLCFAGMPNSSEKQMREIKGWMALIGVIALISTATGVWLLRGGQPWWAAVIAITTPIAMFIVLMNVTSP